MQLIKTSNDHHENMKIAVVYDSIYPYRRGGVEIRNWEVAKRIAKKGHEVHLIGMKDWSGKKDFVKEGVYIHGVGRPVERYTKSGRRSIKQAILFPFLVFPLLSQKKFDIILADEPYFTLFVIKIISFFKKSRVISVWHEIWGDYWYEYLGHLGVFGKLIENISVNISDNIIVPSNTTKQLIHKIRKNRKDIRVIPNGVEINSINKISPSQEKSDVLFVGRLIKDKNVDVLIKAMKLVKESISNVTCHIIGDGPEKEKLVELTKKLELEENIKFTGFIEKHEGVISFMKSSKVFAFPSIREGFGLVIIEANACGLPVIAVNSKCSRCVKELIKDGENGFVLDELNENILAKKIILLLKDENLRNKMKNNGKNIVKKYDWDEISDDIEKLYKEIENE